MELKERKEQGGREKTDRMTPNITQYPQIDLRNRQDELRTLDELVFGEQEFILKNFPAEY